MEQPPVSIRPARPADLDRLAGIERAAGHLFRQVGMDDVADADPIPLAVLAGYQDAGRCWVAAGPDDRPVGYIVVDLIAGAAHIEQVSVHPDWAGRKLGRDLIETVAAWAEARGLPALTLTTFADVPWNGPYYERLGFQRLTEGKLSEGMARIRAAEAAAGLDQWSRIAMHRPLPQP